MPRTILRSLSFVLALALFLAGRTARSEEKRELPDYDGRERPTRARDVLLWGPRVVLAPAYFVSEFVLRRPIGFAIAGAERAGLPTLLYDLFTFGPRQQGGLIPTAYVDFGFRPSVGLYFFYDDVAMPGHDLRLRFATGGKEWLNGSISQRFRLDPSGRERVALELSGLRRPDYTFFGLGPSTRQSALLRYGEDRLNARTFYETRPSERTAFRAEVALYDVNFRRGGLGGDRRLLDTVRAGAEAPPGFERGYTALESALAAGYDARWSKDRPRAGVFGRARVAHVASLRETSSFAKLGAAAGGFVDLNDRGRIVSLTVAARFADPVGHGEIPFTELPTLGGDEPLRGLYPGRLRDRSAVSAELAYSWPIWMWLNGTMRAEVGNVFGEHLEGFEPKLLRWSGALGVESTGSADSALQVMVGAGSETFASGGKVDSLRLVIGTTHGF
jgi:hypothetical protein